MQSDQIVRLESLNLVPSGRTWLYLVPVFTSFGGVDANTFAFFIGCLGPERGVLRGDGASGKRESPAFYGHFFREVIRSHRYCSNSVARAQRSFKNPWFRNQMGESFECGGLRREITEAHPYPMFCCCFSPLCGLLVRRCTIWCPGWGCRCIDTKCEKNKSV